jgi:hypothetical protein
VVMCIEPAMVGGPEGIEWANFDHLVSPEENATRGVLLRPR